MSRIHKAATRKKAAVAFPHKLVLNHWLLSLFNVKSFEELAAPLRNRALEGLDENNTHHFYHALIGQLFSSSQLPPDMMLEYDQNIVRLTQQLNDPRITRGEEPIVWKYFQYLTLLFTEIYLDRYFSNAPSLLSAVNEQIGAYNDANPPADRIPPFYAQSAAWPQLNKLSYWSATGSGKTLIMHVNILQYRYYLKKHGRQNELNRVILLTPNEGLSRQHLDEFRRAGLDAELLNKSGRSLFASDAVQIIDIHKLKEEMGQKTIAVEAFEGNNLVLIDEGHRGASSGVEGAWMRFRNALCEDGFSFEYSATFAQAIKGNPKLTNLYAKSIVFDYSYRHFYSDGFGKDYLVLNLDKQMQDSHRDLYLVACLVAFFQQQRLYRDKASKFRVFNIDRPLWVFVGSKVTATLSNREASDIIEILLFLAGYVANRRNSIEQIDRVLNRGLETAAGKNLFAGRFAYLIEAGLSAEQVFDETLAILFNAANGGSLYIENLKGATGEVALRVGDNQPFGLINIGDDAELCKRCEKWPELSVTERAFTDSLFQQINAPESTLNLLIGSKKFTEGWNSWRVSTMGLMNVGASEGSQIIQLFGRGVRLRGYDMSLKRTGRAELPDDVTPPSHIDVLETLAIFGIHADYMAQFRQFLEEEGLKTNDQRIEFLLPVSKRLAKRSLKTIRLEKSINGTSTDLGDAFRSLGPMPTLTKPDPVSDRSTKFMLENQVVLNWYPKIHAVKSSGLVGGDAQAQRNETHLTAGHVAFFNLNDLYFELGRYKAHRGWHNLNITYDGMKDLLFSQNWYRLQIPEAELAFDSFERVRLWQDIALALLKKYMDRYYAFRKREWQLPHLHYEELTLDDPNFLGVKEGPDNAYYRIGAEASLGEMAVKLNELRDYVKDGKPHKWEFQGLKAIWFGQLLYQPLLSAENRAVDVVPTALNKGERLLVEDLRMFYESAPDFFADKELYLLRNLSRGRGVGFFEAGNFYPDFILWLFVGGREHLVFIDPKGIRNIAPTDPKIQFHRTIKELEQRLGDLNVSLDSFIVSNTPSHTMQLLWGVDKPTMNAWNILFQEEDKSTYVRTMLSSLASH